MTLVKLNILLVYIAQHNFYIILLSIFLKCVFYNQKILRSIFIQNEHLHLLMVSLVYLDLDLSAYCFFPFFLLLIYFFFFLDLF